MEPIKPPSLTRIAFGSVTSWWIANIINPGFIAIAVMLLLMIPLILLEFYFSVSPSERSIVASTAEPEHNSQ